MHKNTPEKIKQAYIGIENKIVETNQYVAAKKCHPFYDPFCWHQIDWHDAIG